LVRISISPVCTPLRTQAECVGVVSDCLCAIDRPLRTVEGRKNAVAHRLDQPASKPIELLDGACIMRVEYCSPRAISEFSHAFGR
jgi:hypothetical protein